MLLLWGMRKIANLLLLAGLLVVIVLLSSCSKEAPAAPEKSGVMVSPDAFKGSPVNVLKSK